MEQYEILQLRAANHARHRLARVSTSHNLKYWTRQPYLGFGVDAHSMLPAAPELRRDGSGGGAHCARPIRWRATRRRTASRPAQSSFWRRARWSILRLLSKSAFFLGLRLNSGVSLSCIRRRKCGRQQMDRLSTLLIAELVQDGLLEDAGQRFCASPSRRPPVLNDVFARLLWGSTMIDRTSYWSSPGRGPLDAVAEQVPSAQRDFESGLDEMAVVRSEKPLLDPESLMMLDGSRDTVTPALVGAGLMGPENPPPQRAQRSAAQSLHLGRATEGFNCQSRRLPKMNPGAATTVQRFGSVPISLVAILASMELPGKCAGLSGEERRADSAARPNSLYQRRRAASGCLLGAVKVVVKVYREITRKLFHSLSGTVLAMRWKKLDDVADLSRRQTGTPYSVPRAALRDLREQPHYRRSPVASAADLLRDQALSLRDAEGGLHVQPAC